MADLTSEPVSADADAPGANPPAAALSFGSALRKARESAGMPAAMLAARLRLNVKQIEALERGDLAALPTLIYVRGFVRGCARELKIDAGPLLADLDRAAGVQPGAQQGSPGNAFPLARLGESSRPIIVIALGALLVAGIVGALLPRRPAASAAAHDNAVAPAAPASGPVTAPPAAPAAVDAGARPVDAHPEVAPPPATNPANTTPAPASSAVPAASATRVSDAAPRAAAVPPAGAADGAAEPAVLVLRMRADAWVEVVQADGSTLLSQNCTAGNVLTVKGTAPLKIVVGNAAAVDAQFRGSPVDLAHSVSQNGVARLTLQ